MLGKPNPTISVTINGQVQNLFMSYGLLTELARVVPTIDHITALVADNDMRDSFIETMLAQRDQNGVVVAPRSVHSTNISLDDVEALFEWGQAHLLGFFLRALGRSKQMQAQILTVLEPSSSTGSEGSPLTTASAGLST